MDDNSYASFERPIGGRFGITRALASANSILPLHWRTEEPTSHPIYGEKHICQGLLVRVVEIGGSVKGKVVARVGNLFQFHGMADFHFVGDATLAHHKDSPVSPNATALRQFHFPKLQKFVCSGIWSAAAPREVGRGIWRKFRTHSLSSAAVYSTRYAYGIPFQELLWRGSSCTLWTRY